MTTNEELHEPTPEFRERLEWELVHTLRREQRIDDRRRRILRRARIAALILVSLAIGATAGFAPAQIREGARRDSLLQARLGDLELTALRLQLARENLADVQRKVSAGVLGESSLASAVSELRSMEARVMRARYDTEEIAATSQPPRDDLGAPVVGDRDFVKDRLQLDLVTAQQRLTAAEKMLSDAERRIRVGAETTSAGLDAEEDVVRARAEMAAVALKLKAREEFVHGGGGEATRVTELMRKLDESQLRVDADATQRMLLLERQRLALLEKQFNAGAIDEIEVMKARVAVREREIELQRMLRLKLK